MKRKTLDKAAKTGLAMMLALTGLSLTACEEGADAPRNGSNAGAEESAEEKAEEKAEESQVFEIDGVTLTIADPAGLADADEYFDTFLGDTHLTGGSTLWPGSTLSGETLVDTNEYQNDLVVMMAVDGAVSDFESLAKGATLDQDGSTVRPDVAWASSEFLVLVFGAAGDGAEVAFAGADGARIKLMAK